MASDAPLPSIATTCGCSLSNLLQRAIDLIDPGRASPADNDDGRTTEVSVVYPASNEILDDSIQVKRENTKEQDGGQTTISSTTATTPATKQEHAEKKKVSFSSSCAPPKKLISASDAILAYKILMHAASFSSSSPPVISDDNLNIHVSDYQCMNDINPSTSWDILSIMADIYRALIVTSNLLLELLPAEDYDDNLTKSKDNDTSFNNAQKDILSSWTNNTKQKCPLQQCCSMDNTPSDYIPSLSSTIHKDILSTSCRSILLLQCLERICAAKAISQRHDNNQNQSNNDKKYNILPLHPALAHKGGDDIHDYDRSISDLIHNYDWHDDGFLPLPFAHKHTSDDIVGNEENKKDKDNQKNQQSNNQLPPSSILHECCYRPQYPNDPPSSQFEMIAWTRDGNFGERIVSLCLDDYQYLDVVDYDDGSDDSQQQDDPRNVQTNDGDNSEMMNADESDTKEETISLNISPAEFEEEEGCLIDIMLAGQSPSTSSKKKKQKQKRLNAKERKKRKRQKKRYVQQLEQQEHANQNTGQKEGFLLLVLSDDTSNSIFQHIHDISKAQRRNDRKTIRVYARLHPSGLLSIEDCSVRWVNENKSMQQLREPLPSRVRYYDFFITKRTKCQPCIPEGVSSQLFHFQLNNIHFLGASTICQPKTIITPHENVVDLLFSIDEGSGGDFIDGFDWVNAFSSLIG